MNRPAQLPPGPRSHYRNFQNHKRWDRLNWFQELYAEHGDLVRTRILFQDILLIREPNLVREVLQKPEVYGKKALAINALRRITIGLFNTEGEDWISNRKLIQPLFHKAHLVGYKEEMTAAIKEHLSRLRESGDHTVELTKFLDSVVLDITFRCVFGLVPDPRFLDKLHNLGKFIARMTPPLMMFDKLSDRWVHALLPKFKKELEELNAVMDQIIEQRRAKGLEKPDDMLGVLIKAHDESPETLSEERLRGEIITFLFAGFMTTSHSISWAFHLLMQHPQHFKQVQSLSDGLNFEELEQLENQEEVKLIRQVFYESLRLYPPIPVLPRKVVENTVLGEHIIPKGAELFIDIHAIHRHPEHWESPDEFRPERHTDNRIQNLAFLPWGAGVRKCIGMSFSIQEAILVIGMFSKALDMKPEYENLGQVLNIVLKPKAMPVRIAWRN